MKLYSGAGFCRRSNWEGKNYSSNYSVAIEMFDTSELEETPCNDYKNLIEQVRFKKDYPVIDTHYPHLDKVIDTIKPELIQWLNENVEDRKDQKKWMDTDRYEINKGWAIRKVDEKSHDNEETLIFFYRKRDALNFINTFSEHKKPLK